MKRTRKRGRPPVYTDPSKHPVQLAIRVPRVLEIRLRQEATTQQRTMTDIMLHALTFFWAHARDAEELTRTRKAVARLERRTTTLEMQLTALRASNATLKRALRRVTRERDTAQQAYEKLKNPFGFEFSAAWSRRLFRELSTPKADQALKRELLKLCHLDKWSQNQPATELAHELTVILTR